MPRPGDAACLHQADLRVGQPEIVADGFRQQDQHLTIDEREERHDHEYRENRKPGVAAGESDGEPRRHGEHVGVGVEHEGSVMKAVTA